MLFLSYSGLVRSEKFCWAESDYLILFHMEGIAEVAVEVVIWRRKGLVDIVAIIIFLLINLSVKIILNQNNDWPHFSCFPL